MQTFLKVISVFFFSTILLSGCVAVGAAAAGGVAGEHIASDNRTVQTIADDKKIEFTAGYRLSQNGYIARQAHVVVVSYNHVVLLVGQVPTEGLRDQAIRIVKGVPKVHRIFNEITIGQPTSASTRAKDTAITANVKARMITTRNLHSSQIKVVTENGVVYLMGLTTPQQARTATIVTKNSRGVKGVVKLIEYFYVTPN